MSDQPAGFKYDGRTTLFIDAKGEDIMYSGFPPFDRPTRFRADLYYEPGFAKTAFFDSELGYEVFLAANRPTCYATYEELCQATGK